LIARVSAIFLLPFFEKSVIFNDFRAITLRISAREGGSTVCWKAMARQRTVDNSMTYWFPWKHPMVRRRGRAPSYLIDYCVPVSEVSGRQHLRSASRCQLTVPRVRRSTIAARAFAVAGPTVWNSLPYSLRDPAVGPDKFRRDLETYLFTRSCDSFAAH